MRHCISAFVLGVLLVPCLPSLPPLPACLLLGAGALVALATRYRMVALGLGGVLWATYHAQCALDARLDAALEDHPVQVVGRVLEVPDTSERSTRFDLVLDSLRYDGRPVDPRPRRISLVSYERGWVPPAGGRCRLYVRLRRPHGTLNPGGFDYETWLFASGIDALGRVIPHAANQCEPARLAGALDELRARYTAAIGRAVADPAEAGMLAALAVGARAALSARQWQVLRDTGTTHMVSISGLHIAMLGLVVAFLGERGLAFVPSLSRRLPAPRVALLLALLAAFGYAALAGFTVPTQRSLIMLAVMAWRRWQGHALLDTDGLLLAVAGVLALQPLACLTASFWLSFGAIGVLASVAGTDERSGRLRSWAATHFWLAAGLAPMLALVVPLLAWTSPLANALVVPLVTWGVVPLTLLGLVAVPLCPACAVPCWQGAALVWRAAWSALDTLAANAPALPLVRTPGLAMTLLCTIAVVGVRLPLGRGRWWLAALIIAGFGFLPVARPPAGGMAVTILDVGQGLAVVVETRTHVLVYDTGPAMPGGRDAGADIVLPFLRFQGHGRIDRLLVSHADNDHAGGLGALQAGLPVTVLELNPLHRWRAPVERCRAGETWHWDGVDFRILHPPAGPGRLVSGNENSCVLQVSAGKRRLLLTGDIEAGAEQSLLERERALGADVLVVPHHGSATSSTVRFVNAVHPGWAVFSVGYLNRFSLPSSTVVERYHALGARLLDTRRDGAIRIEMTPGHVEVERERERAARFWRPD